ncbi:MAG: tripartite tricarboxylate transporter substrate binding protein, partial [Rhodoferax sp.]|nr:tripartite tricarboxylate transporter substrate binding protein [Rhodoferax sp.]
DREAKEWTEALSRAMAHPAYARELAVAGLQSGPLVGPELQALITTQLAHYRQLATEFGLMR